MATQAYARRGGACPSGIRWQEEGLWKEVLGTEPRFIMGLWVCVWLTAVGLGEARNRKTEARSRMEARTGRLRKGQ